MRALIKQISGCLVGGLLGLRR